MSDSLTETVVERLYRSCGYLVERDVPIVAENATRFWSDLDVLAIKDQVLLVNCKDFVSDPKQKTKIVQNLTVAMAWVKRNYADLVADKPIVRQVVYGGCDKATLSHLRNEGIVCLSLEEVLAKYLATLEEAMDSLNVDGKYAPPKGKRWYLIGNLKAYDKLLVYLLNQRFLKVEGNAIKKWAP